MSLALMAKVGELERKVDALTTRIAALEDAEARRYPPDACALARAEEAVRGASPRRKRA